MKFSIYLNRRVFVMDFFLPRVYCATLSKRYISEQRRSLSDYVLSQAILYFACSLLHDHHRYNSLRKYLERESWANSVYLDQTSQNTMSYYVLLIQQFSDAVKDVAWHHAISFTFLNLTKVKYSFWTLFLHILSPLPVRNSQSIKDTCYHYENTHIQIYRKFHFQKLKIFR